MKPVWNSLLIALSLVLLPPAAVAEPSVPESQAYSVAEPTTIDIPKKIAQIQPTPEAAGNEETQETPEAAGNEETQETPEAAGNSESADTAELDEKSSRLQILAEADRLYLAGDIPAAVNLYQTAKRPFPEEIQELGSEKRPEAITDPDLLSPAGRVYWREAQIGFQQKLATRILVPLKLLVEQSPEFIPGHLLYAQALKEYGNAKEYLEVLERANTLYPDHPDLLKGRIGALADTGKWLEASVAARQFALLNPDHPQVTEFTELAETNLKRFRSDLREKLTGNAIANGLLGAISFAVTGNPLSAFSAVQTTALLIEGESALGERIAGSAKRDLELVEDEVVVSYINDLGQKLANLSGRDFNYEFYVVKDKELNAFALPGGKVFVNAGVILNTNSEAELAGLLTHELAHAILSHGFQRVTEGTLLANITQFIPLGGPLTDLLMLDYSRDQERQADILGTRLLVAAGYASDGLYNLMVTLKEEKGDDSDFLSFLSTHPGTKERINYLATLIQRNGYNRYAYEGVTRHAQVKARVEKLLKGRNPDGEKKEEPTARTEANN
ncbi:M48 family metallopeptidase [Microcoleus sp. FACHB-672]|uniref:M48 family metallopeptidase n=1 Tax=Microcoleus sp. FACHB-672 TaxID=2692825 RepID=UPI001686F7E2|nr:M48 family metallopeptidase [Microcoleus sp. FACHB-672]MBD2039619.1 M48 family metalloprotease [Microcoleus sp. FACHB-672]